ncbi:MAG: hypothetical protein OWV35_05515 [Firmicutes bacterium]|nr:hypothetical protein [Bacillota bacterium]
MPPRIPRRVRAAASTVGTVLGLVLMLMGVTAGVAAYRLWHVQQTLDRAAGAAATSEAQNGCWTASTSTLVTQILEGAGLPVTGPHAVQVTQYATATGTPTPYGQLVTAGFAWAVPIAVVHLTLPTAVPLNALAAQPSQYVPPAGAAAANPGCLILGPDALTAGTSGATTTAPSPETTGQGATGTGSGGAATRLTVTQITADAATNTVTVVGHHLPVLTDGEAVTGGADFPTVLWLGPGGAADGNPTYPYDPDWGVQVVTSTPTALVFHPANALAAGQTWTLYLVPVGQAVGAGTAPVGTVTVPGSGGGVYG